MDLEIARKALSKRSAVSSKRLAFFAVAGLVLVAGILLHAGQFFGQPEAEQNAPVLVPVPPPSAAATTPAAETTESVAKTPTPAQEPATAPATPAEQTGEAVKQAEPSGGSVEPAEKPELPGAGMILVSRQPINVLASPSSSAPTTFGFPAGRSFRVIGHEGGFAQIQDVKSGASGWIDEAAVAAPPSGPSVAPQPRARAVSVPSRGPAVAAPPQPKPVAVSRKSATPSTAPKPKSAKTNSQVAADSETATEPDPVEPENRPGLLGGVFKGIFGGGN